MRFSLPVALLGLFSLLAPSVPPATAQGTISQTRERAMPERPPSISPARTSGRGAEPDLAGRQYTEYLQDLVISVPEGSIFISRTFDHGRWNVRVADPLCSMGAYQTTVPAGEEPKVLTTPTPLVLNGQVYTLNGVPLPDAPGGLKMGVVPLSRVVPGLYRATPTAQEYFEKHAAVGVTPAYYTWTDGKGEERRYNDAGLLVSRGFRGISIASFVYTDAASATPRDQSLDPVTARLHTVKDRNGRAVLSLTYTVNAGAVTQMTATDIRGLTERPQMTYAYDNEGRLETVVDPVGTTTSYGYDTGRLKTITTQLPSLPVGQGFPATPEAHVVTLDYQVSAAVSSVPVVPDYRTTPPAFADRADPTKWTPAPAGYIIAARKGYGFGITAFLVRISHNTGESESYVYKYNEATRLFRTRVTDATGREEEEVFDADGIPIQKFINGTRVFNLSLGDRLKVTTRAPGEVAREELDERGNVLRRVNPDGGEKLYEYDPVLGTVLRETSPLKLVTVNTYDDVGNLVDTTVTPPADAAGNPAPRLTHRTYVSGTRRLASIQGPDGRTRVYEYYPSVTSAAGYVAGSADLLKSEYLYAGSPPAPNNPSNLEFSYTYDAYGRLASRTDALGRVTRHAYDRAHRVIKETNALDQETSYIYQGPNLVQVETGFVAAVTTGPNPAAAKPGRITRYSYDSRNRRLTEIRVNSDGVTAYDFKKWAYDKAGRVETETNALGQQTTYGYDSFGFLASVSVPDSAGEPSVTSYVNDAWGRRVKEYSPLYNRATTDAARTAVGYSETAYGPNGLPSAVTEAKSTLFARTRTYAYDLNGHLLSATLTGREQTHLGAAAPLRTGSTAYTSTRTYTPFGELALTGGTRNYASAFTYDAEGRPFTLTDPRGIATAVADDYQTVYTYYPETKWLNTVQRGAHKLATYTYDRVGNFLSYTDGEGNHRHYHYDALNRRTHESVPFASSVTTVPSSWWTNDCWVLTKTSYTRFGEVESESRPTFDPATAIITYANTGFTYDDFGRLETRTSPGSLTVDYFYDLADNLKSTRYPVPASFAASGFTFEILQRNPHNGSLVDLRIERTGYITQYRYDAQLRREVEINPQGGKTTATFDPLGRVASQETLWRAAEPSATPPKPAGHSTVLYSYSLLDQPLWIQHPDHTAAIPSIETRTYDDHGKLLTRSGAGGYPLTQGYDLVGNLTSLVTNYGPGAGTNQTTTWEYNELNLVWKKIYPDLKTWIYLYDKAGRLSSRTDGLGQTTGYTFNAHGLLKTVDYADTAVSPSFLTTNVDFTYDQQGRRLTMTDGTGQTRWTYDSAGRPWTEYQPLTKRTLALTHDTHDQRTQLEVTAPGRTAWSAHYAYDAASRLSSLLDERHPNADGDADLEPFGYAYAPARPLAQITVPSNDTTTVITPYGQVIATTRDALGRTVSVAACQSADPGSTIIARHAYLYDDASQRESETTAEWSRNFKYDEKRQLTKATTNSGEIHEYSYDSIGNRLSANVIGSTFAGVPTGDTRYTPDSLNQYATISGVRADTPQYDFSGNTTRLGGKALIYDQENRLVEAQDPVQNKTEKYVYDGLGRRMERTLLVGTTATDAVRYVYDGWRVVEEVAVSVGASGGAVLRGYVCGPDISGTWDGAGGIGGLLAFLQPSGLGYTASGYFHDGNGNVTSLFGGLGSVAVTYRYTPFGEVEVLPSSGATVAVTEANRSLAEANRYRFSAKEQDAFTSFCYYGFRYYNPSTGRWLNRDPLYESGHSLLRAKPSVLQEYQLLTQMIFEVYGNLLNSRVNAGSGRSNSLKLGAWINKNVPRDFDDRYIEPLSDSDYSFIRNTSCNGYDSYGLFSIKGTIGYLGGLGFLGGVADNVLNKLMNNCDTLCASKNTCESCCNGLAAARAAIQLSLYASAMYGLGMAALPSGGTTVAVALVLTGVYALQTSLLADDRDGCISGCQALK